MATTPPVGVDRDVVDPPPVPVVIAARINAALGDAQTVVNVGAGAGSYEPRDRHVIAIEPSDVMAAQRPPGLPPAIAATAGRPAAADGATGAARARRGPVAILTYVPEVSGEMWLVTDYLPEVGELDRAIFPRAEELATWLGGALRVETIPIHRDSPDWMLGSMWAHPERVLGRDARNATSGFARMPEATVQRVVAALERDLRSGAWDRRHGRLRELDELDVGLRLVVATPG